MIQTFGLIGLITIIFLAWYYSKENAHKACSLFQKNLQNNRLAFEEAIPSIVNQKKIPPNNGVIDLSSNVFLISPDEERIKVETINGKKQQTMLPNQYKSLLKALEKNNPTYKYSIHTHAVYYKLDSPYDKYIIKIDYMD